MSHGGRTIQESTAPLEVNYAPSSASLSLADPLQVDETLSARCIFNGRPLPTKVTYLVQDDLNGDQNEIM